MLSATMCLFSLCYLGHIKRTMARDIEFSITSLVVSRCEGTDTNSRDAGTRFSAESYKPDRALHLDHTYREAMSPNVSDQDSPVNEITEKAQSRDTGPRSEPTGVNTHQLDLGPGANTIKESTSLGLYAASTAAPLACHSHEDGDAAAMPQHEHPQL
ncbi:hypothetical protein BGZ68_005306 [Mortierella alpina]|nr:hypothetical protein BGZ68_005306 [Mortierella alpina]